MSEVRLRASPGRAFPSDLFVLDVDPGDPPEPGDVRARCMIDHQRRVTRSPRGVPCGFLVELRREGSATVAVVVPDPPWAALLLREAGLLVPGNVSRG